MDYQACKTFRCSKGPRYQYAGLPAEHKGRIFRGYAASASAAVTLTKVRQVYQYGPKPINRTVSVDRLTAAATSAPVAATIQRRIQVGFGSPWL
jgi:hypothetical protein